ncbi:FAD:protein FMN transferase [Curvibacter sp. APW13]|uniref:FAD:protein FMN transferase n=1 Tax=Curvibacter sp. APW13 TaxID=3077236 RepID=UPI0028DF5199|nr:FAD:protein FMN transferase [Curvibacter sp. APW13]MDT8990739.1 FAD:protein FMN transferase [Curvibacter sp. APW13]
MALGALWLVPPMARAGTQRTQRTLLGTQIDLQVNHANAQQAHDAMDAAWLTMARLEQMMSRYVADNALDRLHAAAGQAPQPVPPELFAVLQSALTLGASSQGAFDVTVGSLRDWDFRPGHEHVASAETVRAQLPLVKQSHLVLDPVHRTARLRRSGTRLDLGGIAKLPILQAGMAALRAGGIESAMLNGGGDVLVSGGNQGMPWRIGIRDPRQPDRVLGTLALHDGIVASSGDYERCFDRDGRHYHHVLDPRTGYPAQGPHGAVFVAREAAEVNGWGAATLVAGRRFAQRQLAQAPGVQGLVVERDRSIWMSTGMRALLQA